MADCGSQSHAVAVSEDKDLSSSALGDDKLEYLDMSGRIPVETSEGAPVGLTKNMSSTSSVTSNYKLDDASLYPSSRIGKILSHEMYVDEIMSSATREVEVVKEVDELDEYGRGHEYLNVELLKLLDNNVFNLCFKNDKECGCGCGKKCENTYYEYNLTFTIKLVDTGFKISCISIRNNIDMGVWNMYPDKCSSGLVVSKSEVIKFEYTQEYSISMLERGRDRIGLILLLNSKYNIPEDLIDKEVFDELLDRYKLLLELECNRLFEKSSEQKLVYLKLVSSSWIIWIPIQLHNRNKTEINTDAKIFFVTQQNNMIYETVIEKNFSDRIFYTRSDNYTYKTALICNKFTGINKKIYQEMTNNTHMNIMTRQYTKLEIIKLCGTNMLAFVKGNLQNNYLLPEELIIYRNYMKKIEDEKIKYNELTLILYDKLKILYEITFGKIDRNIILPLLDEIKKIIEIFQYKPDAEPEAEHLAEPEAEPEAEHEAEHLAEHEAEPEAEHEAEPDTEPMGIFTVNVMNFTEDKYIINIGIFIRYYTKKIYGFLDYDQDFKKEEKENYILLLKHLKKHIDITTLKEKLEFLINTSINKIKRSKICFYNNNEGKLCMTEYKENNKLNITRNFIFYDISLINSYIQIDIINKIMQTLLDIFFSKNTYKLEKENNFLDGIANFKVNTPEDHEF